VIQSKAIASVRERSRSAKRDSAYRRERLVMPPNVMIVNALFVVLVALAAAGRWAGR
jgi:hypothetical protein